MTVNVTANGQAVPAEVWLGYAEGEKRLPANPGTIRNVAGLRYVRLDLPPTTARTLKVLAHTITPDGASQDWPANLTIEGDATQQVFDLPRPDGQVTLPSAGEAYRIVVNLR